MWFVVGERVCVTVTERKPLFFAQGINDANPGPCLERRSAEQPLRGFVSRTHLDTLRLPGPSAEGWKESRLLGAPPLPSSVTEPHLHSRLWERRLLPQGRPPRRLVKMGLEPRESGRLCLTAQRGPLSEQVFCPPERLGRTGDVNCGPFLVLGAGNEEDT